ncbi:helix-turn-helix domain-containing protein [Caballeronia sp. LZ033]|uniref:helix-turn-helix domain-containing protein n=1 Tax=Caballeronia sp. LZ033 TaxID=3038566 RepID=UPI002866F9BE|nr:helix-turn-helix domain-containing protein [Caballeronia sp. LZ033]MDR5817670.1 helix-turn-helix domain-containing protein [Caballeronia sp. LZ033]
MLYAVSDVLSASPAVADTRPTRYWWLVNEVQERLQDASTCPLSIAELCVQLQLSRRTLQYAFQEALNLNPIAWLRAVRLNHVRRDLRLGASVTSAATKLGLLASQQLRERLSRHVRRTAFGSRETLRAPPRVTLFKPGVPSPAASTSPMRTAARSCPSAMPRRTPHAVRC